MHVILFLIWFTIACKAHSNRDDKNNDFDPLDAERKYLRPDTESVSDAILSPLSALKGMVSHPLSGSLQNGRVDNPQVLHFVLVVTLVFLAMSSTIAGAAGLIFILIRSSKNTGISDGQQNLYLYGSDNRNTSDDGKHPGCVRVVAGN